MLFTNGPKLNLNWLTPALVVLVLVVSIALRFLVPLTNTRFVVLLLSLVGTVFLASAFEPAIRKHGDGGWRDSLKFAIKNLPGYGSAPRFDFLRFYVGLFLLLASMVVSAICV
jgi:hypothetical protein